MHCELWWYSLLHYIDVDPSYQCLLTCIAECGSRSSALIVEMVKVFSCRVPMHFGVSGSLNELGNGVGLWALGNERLSKSL